MSALGETVTVYARVDTGRRDEMGERIFEDAPVTVDNVLVRPLTPAELRDAKAPDGERLTCVLAFPKSYDGPSLRHARISLRGADREDALYVVGDPIATNPCPTDWNMLVACGVRYG